LRGRAEPRDQRHDGGPDQFLKQRFLVLEVQIDRALGNARAFGDVVEPGRCKPRATNSSSPAATIASRRAAAREARLDGGLAFAVPEDDETAWPRSALWPAIQSLFCARPFSDLS